MLLEFVERAAVEKTRLLIAMAAAEGAKAKASTAAAALIWMAAARTAKIQTNVSKETARPVGLRILTQLSARELAMCAAPERKLADNPRLNA